MSVANPAVRTGTVGHPQRRRFWDSRRPQLDGDMELTFGYQGHKDIYTCLGYRARSDQFGGGDFAFG